MTSWAEKNAQRMRIPEPFAGQLRALYTPPEPGRRNVPPSANLRTALAAAHAKGWTLQALADVLGLSRERVRQIVAAVQPEDLCPLEIPDVPPRPLTKRQRDIANRKVKQVPKLTDAEAAELRNLSRRANAGGMCSPEHPAIQAGRQLAALVQHYYRHGYPQRDIAAACGVTKAALWFRLARNGYRALPPSQKRHRPGPIAAAIAAERNTP